MAEIEVRKKTRILLALAILAYGVAVLLSIETLILWSGSGHSLFCGNGGQGFIDCRSVALSDWGRIGQLPVAFLGLAAAMLLLFVSIIPLFSGIAAVSAIRLSTIVSGAIAVGSFFYLVISIAVIRKLCILCFSWDVIVFAFFGVSVWLFKKVRVPGVSPVPLGLSWTRMLSLAAGLLIVLFSTVIVIKKSILSSDSDQGKGAQVQLNPPPTDAFDPVVTVGDGTVTMILFSDFECPYCSVAAHEIEQFTDKHPGKVTVIFKHFPLDMQCNSMIQRPMHQSACKRARLAQCAHQDKYFRQMHDRLFANQQTELTDEVIKEWCQAIGLNPDRIINCMNGDNVAREILFHIEQGQKVGIQGTPTIFINGRHYTERPNVDGFEKVLAASGVRL